MTRTPSHYITMGKNDCFEQPDIGMIWKTKFKKNKFKNFTQRKNNDFSLFARTF